MTEAQYEWFKGELERIDREYNTPELAKQLLQSHGLLDEHGELPERYRSTTCQ